jgi:hypothetical protein
VAVPAPDMFIANLAVFISFTSVQLDPFQYSVALVVGDLPPHAIDAVFVAPKPPKEFLALFNSVISVQEVPSYFSTADDVEPE